MATQDQFLDTIKKGYSFKGENVKIGRALLDGKLVEGADIFLPLKTMNRHGLICGAAGTGKTKTLQLLAECLSESSVPVLLMDIKGDLSGIAMPGELTENIAERSKTVGLEYKPTPFPTEFLSLSNRNGVKLRATVTEFGPILLSKILSLNEADTSVVNLVFKYCDDHKLPLLDLKDFIRVLQHLSSDKGQTETQKSYGVIPKAAMDGILHKVVQLQQQGADKFFGEKSFEVQDLMRISNDGRGIVSILRLTDLQDKPQLFSTFILQMLAELYASSPDQADLQKPRLVMFIDEAHLIFQEANPVLLQQIETIMKLMRSKGIGIFLITRNPLDLPAKVLMQLGMKVQHAMPAITASDKQSVKQTAENYLRSEFYKADELLTQLGTGEALVTLLNEKGTPTPLAHVMFRPPRSRLDVLKDEEIERLTSTSRLVSKYNQEIDAESAYEILNYKLDEAAERSTATGSETKKTKDRRNSADKSAWEDPLVQSAAKTPAGMISRGLLGALGLGGRSKKIKTDN